MDIEHQDTQRENAANPLKDVQGVEVVKIGGNVYAVVGGKEDTLAVYAIDNDTGSPTYGELSETPVFTVVDDKHDDDDDDDELQLKDIQSIESLQIDGKTFIFAGGKDDGISAFSMDADGSLTNTDNVEHHDDDNDDDIDDDRFLKDVQAIATGKVPDGAGGENGFVFAGGDKGVSVFRVEADGSLTHTDNIDGKDTGLEEIEDMDTIQVDDGAGGIKTFLTVASQKVDGIGVFEVGADGTLTETDRESDNDTTFLDDINAVETFTIDGQGYVFAGGKEGGISVFEIDGNGDLTNVGNLADDNDDDDDDGENLNLKEVQDLFAQDFLGKPILWVASEDEGLDVYDIKVDPVTGAVTLERTKEFPEEDFDTDKMPVIDGDSGFVVHSDEKNDSISSYTAPCFAPGTLILTEHGERPVEELSVGDLVVTADRGLQPIRWIGVRTLDFDDQALDSQRPIAIKAGALGNGLPRRDLIVSPQHRIVLSGEGVRAMFGEDEVLALAKGLVDMRGIRRMKSKRSVTYHSLLLDRHEVIFAEGTATDSFRPGPHIMSLLPESMREEIMGVYPALREDPVVGLGPSARLILKMAEIRDLLVRDPAPVAPVCGAADRAGLRIVEEEQAAG